MGLRIADLALRHMAAPSLGHYASLSLGIGHRAWSRGRRSENRKKMTEDNYFPVGAAFQPRSCDFIAFNVVNESTNSLIL